MSNVPTPTNDEQDTWEVSLASEPAFRALMAIEKTLKTTLDEWPADSLERRVAQLEEHQRNVAEAIVSARSVFEEAQASLARLEPALHELPEEGFEWIMANTVYGDLDRLLRAVAAVIAPDDVMTGGDLDAELAKVPGLR